MSFSESFTTARSVNSNSSDLLFGEIDKEAGQSLRSIGSLCNLIYTTDSRFFRFWIQDEIRESFLSNFGKKDLASLRLVCHDFAGKAAPHHFKEITQTFKPRTFTSHASVATLERIGHNVRTMTLKMPSYSTWDLPPLVDRQTGDQITFMYIPQPHCGMPWSSKISHPDYDCEAIADMIVEQYPPLFHAATNVPSFIRAFNAMPNLKHLRIEFAKQERAGTYRRSIVDYALISVRIALERALLPHFDSLSLLSMQEESLLCLQPNMAFCSSPRSSRRWSAVKNLTLRLQTSDKPAPQRTDALKILHSYLRNFTALESLNFRWEGQKGPFPLSLHSEPYLQPLASRDRGTIEPGLQRLKLACLQTLVVENAIVDASQISTFISRHRRTLMDFNFEETTLRSGDWEEAIAPMVRMENRRRSRKPVPEEETMEVPLMFCQEPEEILEGKLEWPEEPEEEEVAARPLSRWLSRYPSVKKATSKVKERIVSDHFKRFVRLSSFGWR